MSLQLQDADLLYAFNSVDNNWLMQSNYSKSRKFCNKFTFSLYVQVRITFKGHYTALLPSKPFIINKLICCFVTSCKHNLYTGVSQS